MFFRNAFNRDQRERRSGGRVAGWVGVGWGRGGAGGVTTSNPSLRPPRNERSISGKGTDLGC